MTVVSYANPIRIPYKSAVGAFGATTATEKYIGPKGRKGLVRDIEIYLTADAVGTTTAPEVQVGTTSGDVAYARFRLGSTAILGIVATSTPSRARSLVTGSGAAQTYEDYAGHVKLETAELPADTAFTITMLAGVGGSPAGTGFSMVYVDWY
jgi:hypothetical protein